MILFMPIKTNILVLSHKLLEALVPPPFMVFPERNLLFWKLGEGGFLAWGL